MVVLLEARCKGTKKFRITARMYEKNRLTWGMASSFAHFSINIHICDTNFKKVGSNFHIFVTKLKKMECF